MVKNEEGVKVSILDLLDYFREYELMRVSDLHLKVGEPPCYRKDGILERVDGKKLDETTARSLIFGLLSEEEEAKVKRGKELDSSYQTKGYRFRINIFYDIDGIAASIRALPLEIPKIEDIGFPNNVWEDIIKRSYGFILITGITGSGKSTTIASLIEKINETRQCRIITLEDPIEYLFKQKKALISQREIGRDTGSFSDGLRAMMREDPDVIFVGEMRDRDSISRTLTASETGHLVFSTLHTRDTVGSITRILDYFPTDRENEVRNQLSLGLSYIISQKLIPKKDGKGRVVAMEILNNDYAVANLIRVGKIEQIYSQIQTKTKDYLPEQKMTTLEMSIANLVKKDIIEIKEAERWVNHLDSFKDLMNYG